LDLDINVQSDQTTICVKAAMKSLIRNMQ